MDNKPRLLSLCAGIGGLDLAAEWAGFQVVGQVEIDPFCRAVLAKHWPDVRRMEDIRDVCGDEFGPVDVLAGGIPCQGNSVAGKRRGRSDDRYLWPEMARLVRATQPRWVLVENVPGMRSVDGGELFADVLRDLAVMGYRVGWVSLEAAEVGAPHKRERVFIVAHATARGLRRGRASGSGGQPARGGETVADSHGKRQQQSRGLFPQSGQRAWNCGEGATGGQTQSRLDRATDGLPGWLDFPGWPAGPHEAQHEWEAPRTSTGTVPHRSHRLRALGNAIVPQQVYPVLAAIRATFPPAERSA